MANKVSCADLFRILFWANNSITVTVVCYLLWCRANYELIIQ